MPKGNAELLDFLPRLNPGELNPSAWIECETTDGSVLLLRYVYYNNRKHVRTGTRDEYRITHLTKFLRDAGAKEGDVFEISLLDGPGRYRIQVIRASEAEPEAEEDEPVRIKLTTGWRRTH